MCEGDIESFIQQFQKIATANKWWNTASLLHICAHLKHSECKCGNHPTLDETLEALRSKYGLTVRPSHNTSDQPPDRHYQTLSS